MGPCMCGDTYCPSCGPAQGNSKCEICGKWTEDGGCDNPEVCNAAADEMYRQLAADEAEATRLADEYWANEEKEGHYPGKRRIMRNAKL